MRLNTNKLENEVRAALSFDPKSRIELDNFIVDGGINGTMDSVIYDHNISGLEGNQGFLQKYGDALYKHLKTTQELIAKHPDAVASHQDPIQVSRMLSYAIKYWNTPQREQALKILATQEKKLIEQGHIKGIGSIDGMGLFGWFSRAWSKVKSVAKKVGKKIKKVTKKVGGAIKKVAKKVGKVVKKVAKKAWEVIKRFNPLSLAIKGGLALAFRLNLFKMSDKLAVGYLSQSEATKRGISVSDWSNAKKKLSKVEKAWHGWFGGKKVHLKNNILSGKRKWMRSLSGIEGQDDELGAVATGASVTAAGGVIAKIVSWIKKLGPLASKLWKGAKGLIKKNPRKKELQDKYGRKKGREMYKAEKNAAKNGDPNLTADEQSMKIDAMAEYKRLTSGNPIQQVNSMTYGNQGNGLKVLYEPGSPMNPANQTPFSTVAMQNSSPQAVGFMAKTKAFISKHKKPIIIVGALLVAATVGGVIWKKSKKTKRKTATTKSNKQANPQRLSGVKKVELK